MKILFAGEFEYSWYEEACAQALEDLGHTVIRFSWKRFFNGLFGKVERHLVIPGPATYSLNKKLIEIARAERPDTILIWRGTQVWPSTLRSLRKYTGARLISYNNDDPFSPAYRSSNNLYLKRLWSCFISAIPEYDLNFVVRSVNMDDYLTSGAKKVHFLRFYFVPKIHRPVQITPADQDCFSSDIVFVGHFENDGRADYIRTLIKEGMRVRVFGSNWGKESLGDICSELPPIRPVYFEEYVKALCGAKICLSFFSKLNRDNYTVRVFEIPACGGLLMSERTSDMLSLYREDEEAVFFSSQSEMLKKVKYLLGNEPQRKAIAEAGYRRCLVDCHDVISRMKELVEVVNVACA